LSIMKVNAVALFRRASRSSGAWALGVSLRRPVQDVPQVWAFSGGVGGIVGYTESLSRAGKGAGFQFRPHGPCQPTRAILRVQKYLAGGRGRSPVDNRTRRNAVIPLLSMPFGTTAPPLQPRLRRVFRFPLAWGLRP
jgi:hypothetical protein